MKNENENAPLQRMIDAAFELEQQRILAEYKAEIAARKTKNCSAEEIIDHAEANPKFSNEVYKDMVRAKIVFILKGETNKVHFYIDGINIKTDGFLLRPIDNDIYYDFSDEGSFTFNNYFIQIPPLESDH